jgi:hypothetical protein
MEFEMNPSHDQHRDQQQSQGEPRDALQLGYTDDQIRVVRRLLAGSPERWPGLLRLYVRGEVLDGPHRRYVLRQLRSFQALAA